MPAPVTPPQDPASPPPGKEAQAVDKSIKPGDQSRVPEEVKGKSPTELATRWERELQAAKKSLSKFHSTARKLNNRYLDERDAVGSDPADAKFNLYCPTSRCSRPACTPSRPTST